MNNKWWYIAIVAVVLVGAFLLFAPESAPNGAPSLGMPVPGTNTPEMTVETDAGGAAPVATRMIRVTEEGFAPSALTVAKGDSVTWVNETDGTVWPASAMHPTHTVYPGSGIEKCGTAEAATIFDACAGIAPGGSWSFVFNEVGTWKYHDHLRATVFGSVTVE